MVNVVLIRRDPAATRPKRGPAPLLDGIRRADWTARPEAARSLGAILADRGEVAYCVGGLDERLAGGGRADAREALRRRWAKLRDAFRSPRDGGIGEGSLVA
jgi:hypothetical protein